MRFQNPLYLLVIIASSIIQASIPRTAPVVVIGGGLSGLATAYYLKKAGIQAELIEIQPRLGGRVKTVRYDRGGSVIYADSGMEEYWESNPAISLLRELKLPTREDVAVSSIQLNGKLYEFGDEEPEEFQKRIFSWQELKALNRFKSFVQRQLKKISVQRTVTRDLLPLKEISFEKWVTSKNLPKKVQEWIRVSIECEIGTGWDRISALDGLSEFHIFVGKGEKAFRVLGGNDKFTESIAETVGRNHIRLSTRVNRVRAQKNGSVVTYTDLVRNVNGEINAKYVVSTIPLYRLFEVQFEPALSAKKRQAIDTMSWGSYFKAHVFVGPKARRFWVKNEMTTLPILSDSELGVIYEGNPDQKGQVQIISLLISGDFAERYNLAPLEQARAEILAAFEKLWPGFSKEVKEMEFHRYHPRAIAAWPPGRSRFDELSQEIRRSEHGLFLAGDFTESSHSDGAFISARRVANEIIAKEKLASRRLP